MTRDKKKPGLAIVAGISCIGAAGGIIWSRPPGMWWVEATVLGLVGMGLFLLLTWMLGSKRWGGVASVGIVGILLMRRWGILDTLSLGLWLAALSLVGLVN